MCQRPKKIIVCTMLIGMAITSWLTFASTKAKEASKPFTQSQIANALSWQPSSKNICKGTYYEPDIIKQYPHPLKISSETTHITAKGPTTLTEDGVSILQKNIVLTQPGRRITSDKAYIYRDAKTGHITKIKLVGHVHVQEAGRLIVSNVAVVSFYPEVIHLKRSIYHLFHNHSDAFGTAEYAIREPTQKIILKNASYSTCSPLDPSWWISAKKITIDNKQNEGKAYNAVVRFKGLPIFFSPYYSFTLHRQRKSGFLMPLIGWRTSSGTDIAWPLYWNIAPNYDLLFTPEYYTLRGARLTAYFRYLTHRSTGNIYASFLPDDMKFSQFLDRSISIYSNPALYNQDELEPYLNQLERIRNRGNHQRGFFSLSHFTQLSDDTTLSLYLNYVTDPYFFQDMSTGPIGTTSLTNQLLNHIDFTYQADQWRVVGLAQAYQTLHIIGQFQNPALSQYMRLPEIEAQAYYPDVIPRLDFLFNTEADNFSYSSILTPNKPNGLRLHVRPGFLLPIYFHGGYLKPQVWIDSTSYDVYKNALSPVQSETRVLPIVAIDNDYFWERNFTVAHRDYSQTLEPHFQYLYVPYKNQNDFPNFDSVLLPFSFEQLYALNRYTSYDRIQNANQLSLGVSQQIIDNTDKEALKADLGLIYYFSDPRVCLSAGCQLPHRQISPIYGDLIFKPNTNWSMSTNIAWDPKTTRTDNASFNLAFHRDARHVFVLGYQFVHEDNDSISTSTVQNPNDALFSTNTSEIKGGFGWSLTDKWSLLAYSDYNINRQRFDTYYGGLQYDTCCWSLRFVTQRSYVNTTINDGGGVTNHFQTGYYVKFELKGLGDIGTGNTDNLIQSTLSGFGQ